MKTFILGRSLPLISLHNLALAHPPSLRSASLYTLSPPFLKVLENMLIAPHVALIQILLMAASCTLLAAPIPLPKPTVTAVPTRETPDDSYPCHRPYRHHGAHISFRSARLHSCCPPAPRWQTAFFAPRGIDNRKSSGGSGAELSFSGIVPRGRYR